MWHACHLYLTPHLYAGLKQHAANPVYCLFKDAAADLPAHTVPVNSDVVCTCVDLLLSFAPVDQPILLPLTSSVYVKGKVAETEKVLVNIGTDYYVEVSN